MKWLLFCLLNIWAFAYQFDCTQSCKDMCGKDYICQIECHTCCPVSDVKRELDCKMCRGYWFLDSCHLVRVGQTNIKPSIYDIKASPAKSYIPFDSTIQCNAIDPDGTIIQYQWDYDGDKIADTTTVENFIVLHINNVDTTIVGCRVKDNSGDFSDWNMTKIVGQYGLPLKKGWNLLSLPTSNSIAFSTLSNIIIAWKYSSNGWEFYTNDTNLSNKLTNLGYQETLATFKPKNGYWIYASKSSMIPCMGSKYSVDIATLQKNRWYLLGSSNKITQSQMANFSNIKIWWKWDGEWKGWSKNSTIQNLLKKNHLSIINSINPTEGFWVKTR